MGKYIIISDKKNIELVERISFNLKNCNKQYLRLEKLYWYGYLAALKDKKNIIYSDYTKIINFIEEFKL